MEKVRKFIFLSILNSKLYSWLILKIIPYIRFTNYYTKFNGYEYEQARKVILPGDVILSVDYKKLTSLMIPGEFCHASFFIGYTEQREFEVIEMTHQNYCKHWLFDVCKEADRIIILRYNLSEEYKQNMINRALLYENAIYDISFSLGVKALYCSELIYQSDYEHRLKLDLSDIAGIGQKYISPTGLITKDCSIIFDSHYKYNEMIGEQVLSIMGNKWNT